MTVSRKLHEFGIEKEDRFAFRFTFVKYLSVIQAFCACGRNPAVALHLSMEETEKIPAASAESSTSFLPSAKSRTVVIGFGQ